MRIINASPAFPVNKVLRRAAGRLCLFAAKCEGGAVIVRIVLCVRRSKAEKTQCMNSESN